MRRLIANVFGDLGGAGYGALVVTLAGTLDLKGYIEILADGRAFVIAEGEEEDLERFAKAICIDNKRIRVKEIIADCRDPTGEFSEFQEILSGKDEKMEPEKESSITRTCLFALADKIEKPERELSNLPHDFIKICPDLEHLEQSIESASGDRPAAESCNLQPEMARKPSLNK
ncbi:MAG: Acylphosphatase [Methanosaeta sp. PtaU1.Bin112]|nr:MAG: Acylphosphatase [Methanosaeta sp. PtaU1.Bin112]